MADTPVKIVPEESKTQTYQEAIEAFQERIDASTAHALDFPNEASFRGLCTMIGRIARERWTEVKSEYADLKNEGLNTTTQSR